VGDLNFLSVIFILFFLFCQEEPSPNDEGNEGNISPLSLSITEVIMSINKKIFI